MGFFDKPRKKLNPNELEDLIMQFDERRVDTEMKHEAKFLELFSKLDALLEKKNIPEKWLSVCEKLNKKFPEIKTETIYKILKGYKDMLAEEKTATEKAIGKLTASKEKAEKKEIHNCYKCDAPLEEGEYYKAGNKYACLKHLGKDQTKLKGVKKNGNNQDLL